MSYARAMIRIVVGGLLLVFAFTALYVAAFHSPRPHGVDIGVVGGPAQAARVQAALDDVGRGAFDVERFDTRAAARAALLDTGVNAVVVPRDRILVVGALGTAPAETAAAHCGMRRPTRASRTSARCRRRTGAASPRCSPSSAR